MTTALTTPIDRIQVAFLGNSIIYFNDCPRLLEHMLQQSIPNVAQDSCLRGGASLPSLWEEGNGMRNRFGGSEHAKRPDGSVDFGAPTVQDLLTLRKWNFAVMNDYTQAPARPETRLETAQVLDQKYGPLLQSTVVILLQTAAYRKPNVNGSEGLGDAAEFTGRVKEGCEYYAEILQKHTKDVRVAPVGDAFLWVHDNKFKLWEQLFYVDDFHPSPHGTWLEACVLYCTMLGKAPPLFDASWFDKARYMQPSNSMGPPSSQDAEELRKAACSVCGIPL